MLSNEEKEDVLFKAGANFGRKYAEQKHQKKTLGVEDCPAFERTMRMQSHLATLVLALGSEGALDYNDRHHLRDVVRFIFDEAEMLGGEIEEMMLAA